MFTSLNGYELAVITGVVCSGAFALGSTLVYLVWFLGKEFAKVRHLVFDKIDYAMKMILDKLEYHEKHDDTRFEQVRKDIWEIRLRNAAKDGFPEEPKVIDA